MSEQPFRVLLVDDEPSLREPLATYLRREHGYFVDTAASGEEALVQVKKAQGLYDVALIDDMLMPDASSEKPKPLGIKLMTEVKTRYPHIEFIIFTGWGMDSALEALRAGAYRYIRKPFDPEELAVMIEHAAEYHRLKGVAREKQILERLMETSTALLGGGSLHDVLDTVLRSVQTIGFDRVRLYLLSEDGQRMVGQAHVGMDTEFVGTELRVADDPYVQALLANPRPQVFEREVDKPLPYEQQLAKEKVNQWACVPLLLRGEVIGKLSVDNKLSRQPISDAELGPVALFASQAAAAIENARLRTKEQEAIQEVEQRARDLAAIQEVSTAINSTLELDKILEATCRAAVELFGVDHSGLVLFEEPDYKRGRVVAEYPDLGVRGLEIPVRGVPAEEQLITAKEPLVLSDAAGEPSFGPVRDIFAEFDIRSILIVPVVFKGRVVGSFSLDTIGRPHSFSKNAVELCRIFAAQVAGAVENARTHKHVRKYAEKLEILHAIDAEMAAALEVDHILEPIAKHIVSLVGARRSLFLLFDTNRNRLIKRTGYGYPPEHLQRLTFAEVEAGVSGWVMRTGEPVLITDAQSDPRNTGIALERAKQFNTVPLIVAPLLIKGEVIGTLTAVNTADDPPFTEEDLALAVMLANRAASALRNARLLEQVSKARNAARVVAEVTALEDLQSTLESIVKGTCDVLDCDVVTLYTYNQDRDELGFPPAMVGVNRADKVLELGKVAEQSVIHNILAYDNLYEARNGMGELLAASPFVKREGIVSSIGVPLSTKGCKVGVMFVNYRRPHRFTDDELINIELFAHQAAVAIRNAQLYEKVHKRAGAVQALYEAGRAMSESLELDEILSRVAEQAWKVMGTRGKQAQFSHVALVDGTILRFAAAFPPKYLPSLKNGIGDIDTEKAEQIGVTGRVVKTGCAQLVGDITNDPDYIKHDRATLSELAVPIWMGKQVAGVINVEHSDCNAFDAEDQQTLESLATQAAIAIHNAQLYQQATRRLKKLNALQQIAILLTGASEVNEVLQLVMAEGIKLTNTDGGSILLWDSQAQEFTQTLKTDPHGILQPYTSQVRVKGGLTRKIIDEQKPMIISDTLQEPCINPGVIKQGYRASLGVPLLCQGKSIGVLYFRSKESRQFSPRLVTLTEALAGQAAVAIERARQYEELKGMYEELKRTKGLVGARTAVAWMGMVSTAWRHTIEGHAITIQEEIKQLRSDLSQQALGKTNGRLKKIERLTKMILDKPITPPLSEEEGVESVSIHELLKERIRQLWENEPYKSVQLHLDLKLDDTTTVRGSPEWLRRVFDVLVDNAVEAMENTPAPTLIVSTQATGNNAEIAFADTGEGISGDILQKLFNEQIKGAHGLGMGLLMAQTIVQTFGGEIWVESAGTSGTCMVVLLPIETQSA